MGMEALFNSNIEDYVANVPAAIAPRHWILEKKAGYHCCEYASFNSYSRGTRLI
jgi:hypothetical protein